jgi:hypothetical protein
MMDQLYSIWHSYKLGYFTKTKAHMEVCVWISQHCLDADDFTFSIGCAMRDALPVTITR